MTAPLRLVVRKYREPGPAVEATRISIDLPSDVDCVEEAVELVARQVFAGMSPSDRSVFRLRVALSEALTNAICCGHRNLPHARVAVVVELQSAQVRIKVTDQGPGFDPLSAPDPTQPEQLERECGRGLFLIQKLCDQVEFTERGNTIWMTLPRF